MLDNFDTGWNFLGTKRDGRYTNLPGGTYVLHLKAANSDGVWNENGRSIKVTIIPPFWQTWWFASLVGLTLIASGVGGYRLRVTSIESQKRELERQVTERTREIERLFEQTKELAIIEERNRLARELHDSAKQKAFAALAQLGTASGLIQQDANAAKLHITEAENLVYDVIQELTFLIQEMYPLALQEKGLATTLREYIFEWENRTDIRVGILIEGERHLSVEVEQAIYRIVQEALANVARHSHATRTEITLAYDTDTVTVSVVDNGLGFSVQQKPKGIGLRSIQERAESIGGRVSIQSAPKQGTQINVTIPVKIIQEIDYDHTH
jgi:NarL family two-component system sensor histidine kinase LiaS